MATEQAKGRRGKKKEGGGGEPDQVRSMDDISMGRLTTTPDLSPISHFSPPNVHGSFP